METSRGHEFKVGLLMVAGIAAIITIVVWTDPVSFASYYRVTAFLDNAGGLRYGSPVTLAGIRIGEVSEIATNPDGRGAIRTTLRVDERFPIDAGSELRLLTSGIFGDSYLEFGPGDDDPSNGILAQDGSAEVIVAPGLIDEVSRQGKDIVAALADVLDEGNRANLERLIANLASSSERLDGVLERLDGVGQRGDAVLAEGEELIGEWRRTTGDLRQRLTASLEGVDAVTGTVSRRLPALADAAQQLAERGRSSLAGIDDLVSRTDRQLAEIGPRLDETLGGLRSTIGELEALAVGLREGDGVLGQLIANQLLAEDVSDTIVNAKAVSERVADHPEVLIWGQTREEEAAQRRHRKAMQARRAFTAGQRERRAFAPTEPARLQEVPDQEGD